MLAHAKQFHQDAEHESVLCVLVDLLASDPTNVAAARYVLNLVASNILTPERAQGFFQDAVRSVYFGVGRPVEDGEPES